MYGLAQLMCVFIGVKMHEEGQLYSAMLLTAN